MTLVHIDVPLPVARLRASMRDCSTAEEAVTALVEAIHAVPEGAYITGHTFGRRHESVGRGWYWALTWSFTVGPAAHQPRPLDRRRAMRAIIGEVLAVMVEKAAADTLADQEVPGDGQAATTPTT